MNGLGSRGLGRGDDCFTVEVTAISKSNSHVGFDHERSVGIGFDKHRGGSDAHVACRAEDATGNLAPVRNQK